MASTLRSGGSVDNKVGAIAVVVMMLTSCYHEYATRVIKPPQ